VSVQPVPPGLTLLGELGRGSRAATYRVRRDGTEFAMRVLTGDHDDGRDLIALRREAALLACVDHPGMPVVHEIGEVDGQPYLVLDLVGGTDLAEVLCGGPLSPERTVRLAIQVAQMLGAAHRAGLVHRDLRPANILIQEDGRARVTDFGLALRLAGGAEEAAEAGGPAAYRAPEQVGLLDHPVDARADLYALGVVMFECLTGRPPAGPPAADPRSLAPAVPAGLAGVVARLLAARPDARYQSCAGLIADLGVLAAAPEAVPELGRFDEPVGQYRRVPLTGRGRELGALLDRFERVRDGYGAVALLTGAPGSGRSRLLDELAARLDGDGHATLTARCPPDGTPLAPLRAAVEAYLCAAERLPEPRRGEVLARVRGAAARATPALARLTPVLARVIGVAGAVPTPTDLYAAPTDAHEAFARAVALFLAELARASGGLLLGLDDVQWLDSGSRRVLHQLVSMVAQTPLMVVVTAPVAADPELPVPADLTVTLAPLDRSAAAELVQHGAFGVRLGEEPAGWLAERGGTPRETLEYLRAVLDAGLIIPTWDGWVLDGDRLPEVGLPEELPELVRGRVHRLPEPQRELLAVAAVLGQWVPPDLIVEVSGADPAYAGALLADAVRGGLLERRAGRYAFVHEDLRAAALAGLGAVELTRLHERAARVLSGPGTDHARVYRLAYHILCGEPDADPARTFATCAAAGAKALADLAPAEAVGYLEQALLRARQAGAGAALPARTGLGAAYHAVGRYADALRVLAQAREAAPDALTEARIATTIAAVQRDLWDARSALSTVYEAVGRLGRRLPAALVPLALVSLVSVLAAVLVEWTGWGFGTARGERRERYRLKVRLLESGAVTALLDYDPTRSALLLFAAMYPAARLGDSREYASVRCHVAGYRQVLGLGTGHRGVARARAAAARLPDPSVAAWVNWSRRVAGHLAGRADLTRLVRDVTTDAALVDVGGYVSVLGIGCVRLAAAGRTREADTLYQAIRARLAAAGAPDQALYLAAAMLAASRGQPGEAADALRQASADASGLRCRSRWANLLLARLQAAVERGDPGTDWEALAAQVAAFRPGTLFASHRALYAYLAYARIEQVRTAAPGRRAEAMGTLRRVVRQLGRLASTPQLAGHHRVARAYLRHLAGDHERALDQLAGADRVLRRCAAPLVRFEAARLRARCHAALGRTDDALREALSAAFEADRQGWQHRARWIREEFCTGETAGFDAPAQEVGVLDRRRLAGLERINLATSRTLDPDELVCAALDELIRILAAERAFHFPGGAGAPSRVPQLGRHARGESLSGPPEYAATLVDRVWRSREPLVVTGVGPATGPGGEASQRRGLRSIIVAPVQIDDRLLGVVYLDSPASKGTFTKADAGLLVAVATQVAAALETARAAQGALASRSAQRQGEVAETLRSAVARLAAVLDPDEVLRQLCATIATVVPAEHGVLLRVEGEKLTLWRDPQDLAGGEVLGDRPAALEALLAAAAPQIGRAGTAPPSVLTGGARVRSWMSVPLRHHEGVAGLIMVAAGESGAYRAPDLAVVAALTGQAMLAYDNAHLFAQVRQLASTDSLTGLSNRRRFVELAEHEVALTRRRGTQCSAMMLDIDDFKRVGERHGEHTGDQVLRTVAARLRHTLRGTDLAARYGGGGFALLLPDAGKGSDVLAERLRAAVANRPVDTDQGPVRVTVSVGVAYLQPDDADAASLLSRADLAMCRAKEAGRDRVVTLDDPA
jgi:diguanylate cyclase (GGDEF)-like protein